MKKKSNAKYITISDIKARAMLFETSEYHSPTEADTTYVVESEPLEWTEFHEEYDVGSTRAKQCQGINLDGDGDFFLVYVDDCFDPPLCIVRADHAQDAEALFASETDYALIEEPDLEDFDEENISLDDNGRPYDSESIMIREVRLIRVDC